MQYFDDHRPTKRIMEGYLFGALGGAAAGLLMGPGVGSIMPMTIYFGLQMGVFETILHSEGANESRTPDLDIGKWGGAAFSSALGTMAAYPGLRTTSGLASCLGALTLAGTASIATYAHVCQVKGYLVDNQDFNTFRNDCLACGGTVLVNTFAFSRLAPPLGKFRPIVVTRAIVFLAVPPLVVQSLERAFQR
jgi:hypothetical protein